MNIIEGFEKAATKKRTVSDRIGASILAGASEVVSGGLIGHLAERVYPLITSLKTPEKMVGKGVVIGALMHGLGRATQEHGRD